MEKLSAKKMQELRRAILAIDKTKKMAREAAEVEEKKQRAAIEAQWEQKLLQLQKILEFDYPDATKDLLEIMKGSDGVSLTYQDKERIIEALIDKKLSEDDFDELVQSIGGLCDVCWGRNAGYKFMRAIVNGKISLQLLYKYLPDISDWKPFDVILQAVVNNKLPIDIVVVLQRNGYRFNRRLIADGYVAGSIKPADMCKLIKYGFWFADENEIDIIQSVISGKNPLEILHPFADEEYRLGREAREFMVKEMAEGKLTSDLIFQEEWRRKLFKGQNNVLHILKAVKKGKLSENLLYAIVEDRELGFNREVWDKLFASGNPVCVKRYFYEFYPELESKV